MTEEMALGGNSMACLNDLNVGWKWVGQGVSIDTGGLRGRRHVSKRQAWE